MQALVSGVLETMGWLQPAHGFHETAFGPNCVGLSVRKRRGLVRGLVGKALSFQSRGCHFWEHAC